MHYHCINNPRKLCPICPSTEEDTDVGKDASVDEDEVEDADDEEVETQPEIQSSSKGKNGLMKLRILLPAKNPRKRLRKMTLSY